MVTRQHEETLSYFRTHAAEWAAKAKGDVPKYNVIAGRNACVLSVADGRAQTRNALDVGCGTGDLVVELGRRGIAAVGVDFAQEMVEQCRSNLAAANVAGVEFVHASIFDYAMPPAGFDLISANGFIEYISVADLRRFLAVARDGLAPGGSLVVGSRNRLFNLYSANAFTTAELEAGTAGALLAESIALAGGMATRDLAGLSTPPLPGEGAQYHQTTGIEVTTRHQYTPAQLTRLCLEAGFEPVEVMATHVHGVPPRFKDQHVAEHVAIANLLEAFGRTCPELLPQSSTFMLHVRRS